MTTKGLVTFIFAASAAMASTPGFLAPGQVPSFLKTATYPIPGASMAAVADVNRDGFLDLITANATAANGASLLLGNGNGTFSAPVGLLAGSSADTVVTGDFNGDGNIDFAVTKTAGFQATTTVKVMLGNGDGTFRPASDIAAGGLGVSYLIAGDFNNDGKTDLAVSTMLSINLNVGSFNLAVMLGQVGGTFVTSSNMGTSAGYGTLIGDFNSDGRMDILILNNSGIKLGNGDGTFLDGTPYPLGIQSGIAYDINGDGKLDIVGYTGGRTRSGLILYSSLGNGDGTFNPLTGFGPIVGFAGGNILAADFNGDGLVDFVNAWGATNNPQALSSWGGPATWGSGFIALGDFDRNGAPDFAAANGNGITVARNTMGNPPLLGAETLDSVFAVGGAAAVTGTVALGAPAPAGGISVQLASDNPAAFFSAGGGVNIPAGATSAPISVSSSAVGAATPVNISASSGTVTISSSFTLVPPVTIGSVTFSSPSILGFFGGNTLTGTVTLNGPASDNVTISLNSSNSAVAAPVLSTVSVAPGANSAVFSLNAFQVTANTPVTISASYQGSSRGGILNVLKATDTVTITKTEYVVSKSQFKVEATSSNPATSFMRVFNALTGAPLFPGSITAAGGGKFIGQFTVTGPFTSVAVQSSNGGLATGPVTQK